MAGATGLVGGHLVSILDGDPTVASVVAPGRRGLDAWADRPKITAPVVDFADLGRSQDLFLADQLFICLGTTLKKAGSKAAFRAVDLEAVRASATVAFAAGIRDVFLVSSVGASHRARSFYLQVKQEAEEAVAALPFRSVHVFRPSVLTGSRGESRPAERLGIAVGTLLAPLMVGPARRYRPIAARTVAQAMARAAADPGRGRRTWESEEIAALGG